MVVLVLVVVVMVVRVCARAGRVEVRVWDMKNSKDRVRGVGGILQ